MKWSIIMELTAEVIFLILYGLGLRLWNSKVIWRPDERYTGWLKNFHYALLVLTVASAFMIAVGDISFAGAWTTRLIIIGFLFSGILIFPLCRWADKKTFVKFYFRFFSYLPIIVTGLFMIPFFGVVVIGSCYYRLTEPSHRIYFEDHHLRVQSTFIGVLGPPRLDIIGKKGLFEERLNKEHRSAFDIDSVSVLKRTDGIVVIMYDLPYYEGDGITSDTLKFEKVD